ncbi:TraR/DksA C4-type zinc finger protein [Desertibacillus haloalkaliphilus]|uniref:TraR/DksA C4-type zinc finger protein n=1 Tax=Desertibacillus haloalkaliphilus TaxID=1328930 RepID=UPI001C27B63A|nr:TraR/DksA C4-type zinc finger protein [Desertibacillus haloalkaliphilus]MBU8906859.1 TraR/DksA C4-type zinc finger protein [Desertibacillus haloalkaliphilus]
MITNEQLSTFRSLLGAMQDSLTHRLKDHDHYDIEKAHIQESVGELSNYDNHPGDAGTELYEREKDSALLEHVEDELKAVTSALQRIDKGTYGRCVTCGKEIPVERLEALPTASHCKEHSPERVVSRNRPEEEDILRPAFGKFINDDADATFYDAEDSWQDVSFYGTSETPSDFTDQGKFSYETMYIDSDEPIGYVEDIESFLTANIDGHFSGVSANIVHEQYETMLDANDDMANDNMLEGLYSPEYKRYGD